jgi:hypothetical protein
MAGRLIDGVRYVGLMNDNSFKSKSLEDNVYFTLRDIFWNGEIDDVFSANHYNGLLTNGISFEERDERFEYTNVLYDYNSDYTQKLYDWLIRLTGNKRTSKPNGWKDNMFEFLEVNEDDEIDMSEYMKYDDWWDQLQQLIKKLEEQLEKHKKWEAQDIERDCDRLAELDYDERDDDYFCEYGCGGEYDYEPGDEILDGGPGSYPEWLNDPQK